MFLVFSLALLAPNYLLAGGSPAAPPLPLNDVVSRLLTSNAQRAAALSHYTSIRSYDVTYNGIVHKHAEMKVSVTYDRGHKTFKIISESGSKLLLDRVLHRLLTSEQEADSTRAQTSLSSDNYTFSLLGSEWKDNRACYVLQVLARHRNKYLYNGKIWVDAKDFAVVHVEAHPAINPSFWISGTDIEHRYERIGEFWLPTSNRSETKIRLGGKAVLTINYSDYQVNP